MKAHWYVVIVLAILVFIYLNSPAGTVPKVEPIGIDLDSYATKNWSTVSYIHSDYVAGRLQARIFNYSVSKKTIGDIRQGKFVGRIYYEQRMRNVAVTVTSGSFDGEFDGSLEGFDFDGNVTGKGYAWRIEGWMEPLALGPTEPTTKKDWTYEILAGLVLVVIYLGYSQKKTISRFMDDAAIDRKLRKFINDNYSKQVWRIYKHKSVPEDAPQWVKVHFTVTEPFGLDCLTIFRIKDGKFTDTSFGVKPYEVEDFWERRISYEAGTTFASPSFKQRGPGRPPKYPEE